MHVAKIQWSEHPTVEEAAGLLATISEQDCMDICEAFSFSTEESAGYGVIDTGATRSIGSAKALELLHELAMTETGKPCFEVLLGKPQSSSLAMGGLHPQADV